MSILGLRPVNPGFETFEIRPQIADIRGFDVTAHTVAGPFRFLSRRQDECQHFEVTIPSGVEGKIVLPLSARIISPQSLTLSEEDNHKAIIIPRSDTDQRIECQWDIHHLEQSMACGDCSFE